MRVYAGKARRLERLHGSVQVLVNVHQTEHPRRLFGDPEFGPTLAAMDRNNRTTVTAVIRKLATAIATGVRQPD
ncbi:MAG: hypothetical protein WD060_00345 [Pirellulales bacterium]